LKKRKGERRRRRLLTMIRGGTWLERRAGMRSWDPSFGEWSSSITIEGPSLLGK